MSDSELQTRIAALVHSLRQEAANDNRRADNILDDDLRRRFIEGRADGFILASHCIEHELLEWIKS